MTHPVNPRSFGMKFIAPEHVTTYTRPPFYSLGGLGTRLVKDSDVKDSDETPPTSGAAAVSEEVDKETSKADASLLTKILRDETHCKQERCGGAAEEPGLSSLLG